MGRLLKNSTGAKLVALLRDLGREPPAEVGRDETTGRAPTEEPVRWPAPFTVRFSVSAGGWIIFLPPGSLTVGNAEASVSNDGVTGRAGWYLIAETLDEGNVYASLNDGKLSVVQAVPDDSELHFAIAYVYAETFRVKQYVCGAVHLESPDAKSVNRSKGNLQLLNFSAAESMTGTLAEKLGVSSSSDLEVVVRAGGKVQYLKIGDGTADDNAGDDDPCNDHPGGGDGVTSSGNNNGSNSGVSAGGADDGEGGEAAGCDGQCDL